MARIRTIKPEFFKHEQLFHLEKESGLPIRVAFAGLWTCCDREGRFKWRPNALKLDIVPYDDCDFSRVLDALASRGFVVKYESGNELYGCVPTFRTHQVINNRESKSCLPNPNDCKKFDASGTREARVDDAWGTPLVGKGREGKGKEGGELSLSSLDSDQIERLKLNVFPDLWNKNCGTLPKVQDFTDSRRKKTKARVNQGITPDRFAEAVKACAHKPFLRGENDRSWVATFDWLVENDKNIEKAITQPYGLTPLLRPVKQKTQYELDAERQQQERDSLRKAANQ